MELGERILAYRKEKGLSQEELAGRLFVTRQAVSKWERGLACPGIDVLRLLAREMGTSLDALLLGGEEPGPYRPLGLAHHGYVLLYGLMFAGVLALLLVLDLAFGASIDLPSFVLSNVLLVLVLLEIAYLLFLSLFPWGRVKLLYREDGIKVLTLGGWKEIPYSKIESIWAKTHGSWPSGRLVIRAEGRAYRLYPMKDVNAVKTVLDELCFLHRSR